MLFKRIMATDQAGLPQVSRQGLGLPALFSVTAIATDSNLTMTVAQMAGGFIQYTGFSAGRTDRKSVV